MKISPQYYVPLSDSTEASKKQQRRFILETPFDVKSAAADSL
jgi:hypothetical protein